MQYDRAMINLGDVTNVGGATTGKDEMLIFSFDAVVIDNPAIDPNEIYWVSAGSEYNYESEIWVGQASFTVYPEMPVGLFTKLVDCY